MSSHALRLYLAVRFIALSSVLVVSAAASAQEGAPGCIGAQTLTRAEVEAAGVAALPDLLRLLDAPRRTTVDGYRWRTHTPGNPFEESELVLLLDGEPLAPGPFGEADLHLVPLAIGEVEGVVYCPAPRLVAGAWVRGGTLDIRTRPVPGAQPAPAVRGALTYGNESGDPGPQRYLDPSLLNVDRIGLDQEAAVAFRGVADVQGGYRFIRTFPTDEAIVERNEATGVLPRDALGAASLRAEIPGLGGRHTAHLAGGWEHDLWFFRPAGRELAVRRLVGQAGVQGTMPVGRTVLGYRVGAAENRLDARVGEALGTDPAWREHRTWAGVDARFGQMEAGVGRTFTLGARVDRVEAEGPGLDRDEAAFTLGRLSLRAERAPARGLRRQADLALVTTGRNVVLQAATTAEQRLEGGHTLALLLSAAGALPEETPDYGFWAARGYAALQRTDTPYDARGGPRSGTRGAALFTWAGPLGAALHAEATLEGRAFRGLTIERAAFRLAPGAVAVEGPVVADHEARGETLAGRAAVSGVRGVLSGRAFYTFEAAAGGTEAFREAWDAVPRHRAGLAATVRPGVGFTAHAALEVLSAAHWADYRALDGSGRVPPHWLLDASLAKTFWSGRLRASALVRNVLDTEERYHPLGATLAFRLFLRLEARF